MRTHVFYIRCTLGVPSHRVFTYSDERRTRATLRRARPTCRPISKRTKPRSWPLPVREYQPLKVRPERDARPPTLRATTSDVSIHRTCNICTTRRAARAARRVGPGSPPSSLDDARRVTRPRTFADPSIPRDPRFFLRPASPHTQIGRTAVRRLLSQSP